MSTHFDAAAKQDFWLFVQFAHKILRNKPLGDDRYLEYLCYIANQFAQGKRKRVIVNMPPGFGKTTVFSICMIPWLLGHDPTLRIMFVSHSSSLASEVLALIVKLMKSEAYQRIFTTRIRSETDEGFQTADGGGLFACSVRGSMTGKRADVIIGDDLLAIKHAGNLARIHRVNEVFDKEIISRLSDPENGRVMVVMHRLHEDDLTGHLMQKDGYDKFALSLVAERAEEYQFDGLVWCRPEGEQLRPGLYSERRLQQLMEEDGTPSPRLLYQQASGDKFDFGIKPKHFPLIDRRDLPRELPVIFSIDASQKDTPQSSCNVILVMARFGDDDIVLHQYCAQSKYVELYDTFHALAKQYHPSAVVIEHGGTGSALISQLQREGEFEIISVDPKGSKTKRLRRHLRRIKEGHVQIPKGANWFGDFVGEFIAFPDGPTDRIDALTMGLDFLDSGPALRTPRRRERAVPAGIGSSGPIKSLGAPVQRGPRGAALVTGSSLLRGPAMSIERPPQRSAPNDEITVIMATPHGVIRRKV
jgi:predicted phage terminase large subunit-like protein